MAKKKWVTEGPKKGKGGKTVGTVVVNKETGVRTTLLNPHGKYSKYSAELKNNQHLTNDGQKKTVRGHSTLSKVQKAYRAGYRSAVIDQTKAYNAKKGGQLAQGGGKEHVEF